MSEIKERCTTHGDIDLRVEDVIIRTDKSHRKIPYYEFDCDNHRVRKAISSRVLEALSGFGVAVVEYDSATNPDQPRQDIQSETLAGKRAGILSMTEIVRFERLDNEQLRVAAEQELFANPQ